MNDTDRLHPDISLDKPISTCAVILLAGFPTTTSAYYSRAIILTAPLPGTFLKRFAIEQGPFSANGGDEHFLFYNPVKIVKFIRKKETYLNG